MGITRRRFLGQASCAAIGSTTMLSTIANLGAITTMSARPHILEDDSDYKAIICILLAGGADSHNMLIPYDVEDNNGSYSEGPEYTAYKTTRTDLTLDHNELSALSTTHTNGKKYAVNASMQPIKELFDDEKLSFISNIGTLIQPVNNVTDYENGTKKLPIGLYSHADQIMQWQTSVPQSRSAVGVGGRMADVLNALNGMSQVSMNISLDGKNRFQAGQLYNEYSVRNSSNETNVGFDNLPSWWSRAGYINQRKNMAIDSMAQQEYLNIFEKTMGNITKQTIETNQVVREAFQKLTPLTTVFSDNPLSGDFKKMAEMIKLRGELGQKRQIFFTTFGGWDHHDDVKGQQNAMLPVLSNGLKELNLALEELGLADKVTTFTISDFARTLTSNGNGSDHGWGGNNMIMGGAVKGGRVFGEYPTLNNSSDRFLVNRGRIIPKISVDEFYAEVAMWFGVDTSNLHYLLPNLCNFYSSTCPSPVPEAYMPIGMFA